MKTINDTVDTVTTTINTAISTVVPDAKLKDPMKKIVNTQGELVKQSFDLFEALVYAGYSEFNKAYYSAVNK